MTTAVDVENYSENIPSAEVASPIEDRQIHLARCAECGFAVRYEPLASGTGFQQHDQMDANLGIGENGRPTCTNGHGEMEIADDKIPAADAFALAQEQLDDARQPRLPIPTPPFNYEGVLHSLIDKRHIIANLERKVEDRKSALKRAKDDLDEENAQLGKMLDEFEKTEQDRKDEIERRAHQAEAEAPRLVRCKWEATRPDAGPCPLCTENKSDEAIERLLGRTPATLKDSEAHVEDVDAVLDAIDIDIVVEALELIDMFIHREAVASWTVDERKAVGAFADALFDLSNGLNVAVPERPAVLGKPHIPAERSPEAVEGDEPQVCSVCEKQLPKIGDRSEYSITAYVGTDCSGKAPAPEHHYPEKKAKTPAKKAAKR